MSNRRQWPLSQLDAFFVAHQEQTGVLMQMAAQASVAGDVRQADVDAALGHVLARWPPLGMRLRRKCLGLAWSGEPALSSQCAPGAEDAAAAWRNRPIDPFSEAPFQVWWRPGEGLHTFDFRAHHAVADGELFLAICAEALRALAGRRGGAPLPTPQAEPPLSLLRVLGAGRMLRRGRLPALWREARRQAGAGAERDSARVALESCDPGDTSVCARRIEAGARRALDRRAAAARTSAPWLCAAAWARALHARNRALDAGANPRISLEVPVSLRHSRRARLPPGNFVSPVVVAEAATGPAAGLARRLGRAFRAALHRQAPAALPLFTWPGRSLPWALFRRLASTPAVTGSATSHFTWMAERDDLAAAVARTSGGRLQLVGRKVWTPVCLHMGVSLLVLADADALHLFVNFRTRALRAEEAEALVEAVVAELTRIEPDPLRAAGEDAGVDRPAAVVEAET